jgi:hypothetical protein
LVFQAPQFVPVPFGETDFANGVETVFASDAVGTDFHPASRELIAHSSG